MRVADSSIIMDATRSFLQKDEVKEQVRVWVDPPQAAGHDTVSITDKARALHGVRQADAGDMTAAPTAQDEVSLKTLIVEILSGRKIRIIKPEDLDRGQAAADISQAPPSQGQAGGQRVGWGVQYDYEQTHLEQEAVSFEASGVVRTQDGREIGFTVSLSMSREFMTRNTIALRAGDAALTDPLVINYGGGAADLLGGAFAFDIDSDGVQDSLPLMTAGRGFLAFDKNADGVINDGGELFGPSTGDGFAELAGYDGDGNRWIDENDAVFDQLQVMTVSDGIGHLQTLAELGIGAIHLGNLSTAFDVRGADNALMGRIGRTGLFLREDGTPGTIQHLDIVT
ncbi:MAG TPA: VCBS repeat-containing protein [Deltaproteobacteria bacterium]|nr:VCBS repeat-containing protein [Deltaproteobacteria bacterium]